MRNPTAQAVFAARGWLPIPINRTVALLPQYPCKAISLFFAYTKRTRNHHHFYTDTLVPLFEQNQRSPCQTELIGTVSRLPSLTPARDLYTQIFLRVLYPVGSWPQCGLAYRRIDGKGFISNHTEPQSVLGSTTARSSAMNGKSQPAGIVRRIIGMLMNPRQCDALRRIVAILAYDSQIWKPQERQSNAPVSLVVCTKLSGRIGWLHRKPYRLSYQAQCLPYRL